MARRIGCMLLVLTLFLLILSPASAWMRYDIIASAGGPQFVLHRYTQYMNFSVDGSVSGVGNFSRYNNIKDLAGVEANERTSCTKESSLDYDDKIRLITAEGPVYVTVNFNTENIRNVEGEILNPNTYSTGNIKVDEYWPFLFADLKKISYSGPGISTRERYTNNGDTVITAIDSWKLNKQSLYRASLNRTHWDAYLTPTEAQVKKYANKTSEYTMGLESTGSLSHLDIIRRDASGGTNSRITQDYSGHQIMNLKIKMGETINFNTTDDDWLPCCFSGYLTMPTYYQRGTKGFGSNVKGIFDCTCWRQPGECGLGDVKPPCSPCNTVLY